MIARIWREDIETSVYYPEDERYLIERAATVKRYGVVDDG